MALIGTISGSNGTSTTAVSGSVIFANRPNATFPSLPSGVTFYVSGTRTNDGSDQPSALFTGDTFFSGALGTDTYIQMKPVGLLPVPTNTTASYIYTSGSTNDLYFTQYQPGTGYTNTTRLRWLESELQTGLLAGGVLSTTSGSTTYNISSGSGVIVSQNASTGSEPYPTVRYVSWPALANQSLPSIGSTQITYVGLDSTGAPYLKSVPFVDGEYHNYIVLGRVLHTDKTGTNGAVTQPLVSYGANQYRGDFVRAFGPIKLSGHTFYVSGTTGLKKDAGESYVEGRNYTVDPNSPNYVLSTSDTTQNTSKIFYEYVDGAGNDVILNNGNLGYTAVDFANYNNAGTLTTVGAGLKFTIQRVFWFPSAINRAFYVYYGNAIYTSITEAQAAISTETFVEGKNTRDAAVFLGYLIVKGTGVNFTDPTTYKLLQAGSFRAVGSTGAGPSGTPGGSDTQVQFNDLGAFNGSAGLTYNKTTDALTGTIIGATAGFSGSLTKLTDGTSYLIAGSNVTVATGSNGAVTIAANDTFFTSAVTGSIYTTGSVAFKDGEAGVTSPSNKGTDVFFYVSGSTGVKDGATPGVALFGGSVVFSGSIYGGYNSFAGLTSQDFISQRFVFKSLGSTQIVPGADTNFFVSGSTGSKGTATRGSSVFGGDVVVSGVAYFPLGMSGSLTKLSDGTSYLVAGNNVTITSSSNGAVTIAGTVTQATGTFNDSFSRMVTTASVSFAGAQGASYFASASVGTDVFFFVSGTRGLKGTATGKTAVFGGDVAISGSLFGTNIPAGTSTQLNLVANKVTVSTGTLSGIGSSGGADVIFYVSGTNGGKGTSGTSVFTGDLLTSGTFYVPNMPSGVGTNAVKIDTATGKITYDTSDERLKGDIATIENGLSRISSIRGVTFTSTVPGDSQKSQVGMIAQEVLQTVPEIVNVNAEGYYSIDYARMVGVLVAAIKEQQVMIENLRSRIENLEQSGS